MAEQHPEGEAPAGDSLHEAETVELDGQTALVSLRPEPAPAHPVVNAPPVQPWRTTIREAVQLFVLLLMLIPLHDFLKVSLSRMNHPFELEWLEGELAVYSLRFLENPSLAHLYPPYEQGTYVPHLYPPTHQVVTALLYKALLPRLGSDPQMRLLAVGRGVSIAATLLIMLGVLAIVREATGSWWGAALGALVYPMYYKMSGFWYDIYKVDSLAYAFAVWSAYLIGRRRSGLGALCIGGVLALLALFTKQTSVFIPVLALAVRVVVSALELARPHRWGRALRLAPGGHPLVARPGAVFVLIVPALLFLANLLYLFLSDKFAPLWFYLFEVPSKHHIFHDRISDSGFQELWQYFTFPALVIPLGLLLGVFGRRWKALPLVLALLAAVGASVAAWFALGGLRATPIPYGKSLASPAVLTFVIATWPPLLALAASLTVGGLAAMAVRWLLYRTLTRGFWWLGVFLAAAVVAPVSWVKVGGYINNFIPMVLAFSVVMGLAAAWAMRGARRLGGDFGGMAAAACVGLPLLLGWHGTRDLAVRAYFERGGTQGPAAPAWITQDVLRLNPPNDPRTPEERVAGVPRLPRVHEGLPFWLVDGLKFHRAALAVPLAKAEAGGFKEEQYAKMKELGMSWRDRVRFGWFKRPYRVQRVASHYGEQIPGRGNNESTAEWGPKLLARIAELQADGGVYLPHQNYLGHLAGVPVGPSIDSIRDVEMIGKATPPPLLRALQTRRYKHLVTIFRLEQEWMTGDFKNVALQQYEFVGPLLPQVPYDAYRPVTGTPQRPEFLYRLK